MTQEEKVFRFIKEDMKIPMTAEEIAVMLSVPKQDMTQFAQILQDLEENGKIVRTKKKRYAACMTLGMASGKFIGNERGFGFVEAEDAEDQDIFIKADHTGGALHGDTVLVRILSQAEGDNRPEGEVVKILRAAEHKIVGRLDIRGKAAFLVPINRRYAKDFFIPMHALLDAKNNDMVVAELSKRGTGSGNPEGRVVSVLGNIHTPGVDILSVLESRNIPHVFPEEVLEEAEHAASQLPQKSENRLDLRNEMIITIDGDDAKDLDDAVHVKKLPNGNFQLGVHIADVGHYVPEGSIIDKEAYRRGTSIYLADRVIPMLPESLSNGICSLNEGKDRLTLSVIMEIDRSGTVTDHTISESIICSSHRMTYTNVTAILEGDKDKRDRFSDIVPMLEDMVQLRNILRNKRISRGSIDFNFDEARIVLDANGTPVDIVKRERSVSNSIIEEFMLACNETVAEHVFWLNLPLIYRVHEEPDTDSVKEFAKFIAPFGYAIKHSGGKVHPRELAELLRDIRGRKEEMLISHVALRSLMKARYSEENGGHFGLASSCYCHFTSPIRRYPDLAIHRMIKTYLTGHFDAEKMAQFSKDAAKQSTERELEAVDAERTVEDMKKAEFMQERLGDVYDAVISGVTSFGVFATLENTVEGLIRFGDLNDDYYVYDDALKTISGERTGKVYRVGDTISVQVARVDVPAGKIDFVMYSEENPFSDWRKKHVVKRKQEQQKQKQYARRTTARYLKKNTKRRKK